MKTMVKIIGTLLLLAGIVGIMVFGSRVKIELPKAEAYHTEEKLNMKEIQKLKIQPDFSDLEIVLVDQGDLRAVLDGQRMKNEQIQLLINKEKNQASIEVKKSTKSNGIFHLTSWVRFHQENYKLVVYLPKQKYEQVQIEDGFGNIFARDIKDIKDFMITSYSGNIEIENYTGGLLSIEESASNIELNKIQANLAIDTDYGDIRGEEWKGSLMDLRTESGNINVKRIDGKIVAESGNGDIELKQLIGNYDYQITNQMGNVTVSYLTPPSQVQFDLTSEDGKVRMNLPGAMQSVNQNQEDSMEMQARIRDLWVSRGKVRI